MYIWIFVGGRHFIIMATTHRNEWRTEIRCSSWMYEKYPNCSTGKPAGVFAICRCLSLKHDRHNLCSRVKWNQIVNTYDSYDLVVDVSVDLTSSRPRSLQGIITAEVADHSLSRLGFLGRNRRFKTIQDQKVECRRLWERFGFAEAGQLMASSSRRTDSRAAGLCARRRPLQETKIRDDQSIL
jgi:hypothetical protein